MRPPGLEPGTCRLGIGCAILLRHGRVLALEEATRAPLLGRALACLRTPELRSACPEAGSRGPREGGCTAATVSAGPRKGGKSGRWPTSASDRSTRGGARRNRSPGQAPERGRGAAHDTRGLGLCRPAESHVYRTHDGAWYTRLIVAERGRGMLMQAVAEQRRPQYSPHPAGKITETALTPWARS